MSVRRRMPALVAGVGVVLGSAVIFTATGNAAVACSSTVWAEGVAYTAGRQVTYRSALYQALVAHTAWPGTGWNPAVTPTLWKDLGACEGGTTPTTGPSVSASPSASVGPSPSTSVPGGCGVKGRPAGKVLQGYWENWDGAANGVHPGLGWIPISDSRITQHGYNVLMAAFPVIRADGTVLWEDGMDSGVKVPTAAEICAAKAQGATVLMSIGGAAAGIDLSSSAVADRFVATIVPILKRYDFDGIDIDIETGLSGSGSIGTLSTSQANLIRIIDGVLAAMPAGFGLTMAPETAYVTGGSVTYGSIWGSYLPIIKKYLDDGRLWWLNMQYYNGSMYGCSGDSYAAGTIQGFTAQTRCLADGLTIQGTTIRIPYDKQVPGLPAQPGAGGGYLTPALVAQAYQSVPGIKGLMTWSINWDGSRNWTFADNVKALQGR
ncbi:glycosyl hydrolase family 18 protein [Actinoplanes utahensis]|uniref:chitinase n=1 Tax=Actinoplanes utahensis TaxID=1869 RepID=A0A0A6UDY5_ACTUT|nr:glycosyl hydrolase family 18 protein [Actinoplanes utahensis]KHD73273.1 glycoside hydrolase family 18 [Actinoplanes utahensis]GIF27446.1 hypothetical protein Aut01nite_04320 [Actinoplanes utahensis]